MARPRFQRRSLELGYGDGGEATVVGYGPDANNKYITTYFRHAFDVPDPAAFTALSMSLHYDDGAVVYLNGLEVARVNMPGTPGQNDITFTTPASSTVEEAWGSYPVDPGLLLAGTNVMAVEIHQVNGQSSDISFALALGQPPGPTLRKGPYLMYTGVNTQMTVLWQTADMEECLLEWGRDTSYAEGSVRTQEVDIDHRHEHVIDNLVPGLRYYYRVTDQNNDTYTGDFLAAPPRLAKSVKFLGYGDTRSDPMAYDGVSGQMVQAYQGDPAFQTFALHSGDWTIDDSEGAWDAEFFPPWRRAPEHSSPMSPSTAAREITKGRGPTSPSIGPTPMRAISTGHTTTGLCI
jgi:hypothetical protein